MNVYSSEYHSSFDLCFNWQNSNGCALSTTKVLSKVFATVDMYTRRFHIRTLAIFERSACRHHRHIKILMSMVVTQNKNQSCHNTAQFLVVKPPLKFKFI